MAQQPHRKQVTIDVNEFVRTRDALGSAYLGLSASLDKAVKAYLDHTDVVLAGDGTLNVSYLTQPFVQLAQTAQQALLQGSGLPGLGDGLQFNAGPTESESKRRKRGYKKRDPNAPKRPQTAYFRYLNQNRGDFVNELNESTAADMQKPGDVTRLATAKWHKLTDAEREAYREAYKVELREYEEAVARYKASLPAGATLPEDMLDGIEAAVQTPAPVTANDDTTDDSSDSSSDSEEEPPPPPKTPSGKSSKASKKAAPEAVAPASSPERKRRANTQVQDVPDSKRPKASTKPLVEPPPVSESKDKKRKKRKSVAKTDE